MAVRKQTFEIEFDYSFWLFGILSTLKDYRLCFQINRSLDIDLCRMKNLEITLPKSKEIAEFPLYIYEETEERQYIVIGNKANNSYLVPEQPKIDYFMLLKGPFRSEEKADLKAKMIKARDILGVYELEVKKLKSKENLIF